MTRISKALNSGDLAHHEYPCDADVLQATGSTAVRAQLGVLIVEAMEGAAGDGAHSAARVRELQAALAPTVRRIAMRWRLEVDVAGVSALVVRELILDRCPACEGRGFTPVRYDGRPADEGAKHKRHADCTVCLGSGAARRNYEARAKAAGLEKYTRRLGYWWEAVLQSCCDAEIDARAGIRRRLRHHA